MTEFFLTNIITKPTPTMALWGSGSLFIYLFFFSEADCDTHNAGHNFSERASFHQQTFTKHVK